MAKKGAVLGLFALLVIIIGIALAVYFSTKKVVKKHQTNPNLHSTQMLRKQSTHRRLKIMVPRKGTR